MSNLFLVPAGDPRAQENFQRTVQQRVAIDDLAGLSAAALKGAEAAPGGVSVWGTKAGEGNRNVSPWNAMGRGDWVLFYVGGLFPVAARVLAKERAAAVARRLWGEDEGETWEYLYLLDEVRQVDIPRLPLNESVLYKLDSFPRGFSRVRRDLEAEFGSVEQLLEQLSGAGHQIRFAIEALKAGDESEAAVALDRLNVEFSEEELRREVNAFSSSDPPRVRRRLTESLQRNYKLVEKLKKLYEGKCQYCGFTFQQNNGKPYCEAAHLKPMALREADIDVKDNIFILCPNHHKMLDYGPLRIERNAGGALVGVIGTKKKRLLNKHVASP